MCASRKVPQRMKTWQKGQEFEYQSILCRKEVERNMLPYFVEESENKVFGKWEVPYFVEEFEDIVGGKWEVRLYFARPRNSSLEAWEFIQ